VSTVLEGIYFSANFVVEAVDPTSRQMPLDPEKFGLVFI